MNTKTNEKIDKWCYKLCNGDVDIEAYEYTEEHCRYIHQNKSFGVDVIVVAADDGDGFKKMYSVYKNDASNCDGSLHLLIKDDNQLIVQFENGEICSFGFDGAVSSMEKLFCCIRTKNNVNVICASKETNSIEVVRFPAKKSDIFTSFMFELITNESAVPIGRRVQNEFFK